MRPQPSSKRKESFSTIGFLLISRPFNFSAVFLMPSTCTVTTMDHCAETNYTETSSLVIKSEFRKQVLKSLYFVNRTKNVHFLSLEACKYFTGAEDDLMIKISSEGTLKTKLKFVAILKGIL